MPDAFALKPRVDLGDRVLHRRLAVQADRCVRRVDVRSLTDEGFGPRRTVDTRCDVALGEPGIWWILRGDDGETVGAGEVEVALVATRHGHDRAGPVPHEHVVGDPDRNLCATHRVGRIRAGEGSRFLARVVRAIGIGELGGRLAILRDRVSAVGGGERTDEWMLGRKHHERGPEQRVGPCGEHLDVSGRRAEANPCSRRATDPVALHQLDRLWPVESVEVVDQAICIRRDAHRPLAHVALEHRIVADVAATFCRHFLVREDGAESWTPVDRRVGQVDEAMVIDEVVAFDLGQFRPRTGAGVA